MHLTLLDWSAVAAYFAVTLILVDEEGRPQAD